MGLKFAIIFLLDGLFIVFLPIDLWPCLNKATFLHNGSFLKHFVVRLVMGSNIVKC